MKFLLWLGLGFLLVTWLMRGKKAAPRSSPGYSRPAAEASGNTAEAMVRCAHCGLHVPQSEAIMLSSGTGFCSDEHRRLHAPS
jgi:uncharacterized protein